MNASDLPDETLFEGALKCRTPEERAAYLDQACAGQPALRRNLEALLQAHDQSGEFLEPTVAAARPTIKLDLAPEETSGTMIGRYKLLQKIGEGGMGVVYMAEQTEPVIRKVALKIIKVGMDSKQVVARFEAERQALALMDHPNIAKILDAGVTESPLTPSLSPAPSGGEGGRRPGEGALSAGRPYFVMELVHGVPITEYCDKNKLTTQQRLELFIPVCQAIQHAHQKGVIHRDIKPSNVMVTLHDGVPVPKVIDFGVAKATNQRLTEKTLFTHYAQMIGTPAYMSPEQAEMSGLDIDTRSDIYSLGVLLYELLTGSTPFDAKELLSKGYAEMQRIIAQEEPPKPSTRMSTMQHEQRTAVATNHSMPASALSKALQGDLDWIVMKCLEKDRTRRYETSNGLAADLRRHLSNELITARPPTTGYLIKKLIKRNKLAFAAGTFIVAVLVMATGISTWQAVRAAKAEKLAKDRLTEVAAERDAKEQARKDAEGISTYLENVFQSPDPRRDGRAIKVVDLLAQAEKKLETDLASQPDHRAKLLGTLGKTYSALGLYREAIPLQEKVRDYYRAASGSEHPATIAAMEKLAYSYFAAARYDEAVKLQEEVLAFRRKNLGLEHPDTLVAMEAWALYYSDAGHRKEACKEMEKVVTLMRKVNGPEHAATLGAMARLGYCYGRLANRHDPSYGKEALKLWEELLPIFRKVHGPEHPATLVTTADLASYYFDNGRQDEALKLREAVLSLCRKVHGTEHPDTLWVMGMLAYSYHVAGRREEALTLREELVALSRKINDPKNPGAWGTRNRMMQSPLSRDGNGSEHPFTLSAMHGLADSYFAAGRKEEALKLREEVLPQMRENDPEHPGTLWAMNNLADSYSDAGRNDEALKLWEELVPLRRKVSGLEDNATFLAMHNLANSYSAAGRLEEELKLQEELLPLRRKVTGPEHADTLWAMHNLANSYSAAGRTEEALKLREEVLVLRRKVNGLEDNATFLAMHNLASSYSAAGQWDEALKLLEELLPLRRKVLGPEHRDTFRTMDSLLSSYMASGRGAEGLTMLAAASVGNSADTICAMKLAALQVWFGKVADHTATCQRMLQWASGSDGPDAAERVAKLTSLRRSTDRHMLESALTLAQRAVQLGRTNSGMAWYQMTLGMAEYRNGHYPAADQALMAAVRAAAASQKDDRSRIEGTAGFYRAMSLFQQGKTTEARRLFAETEATMKPLPAAAQSPLIYGADHNDLILWLACKESKALLNEPRAAQP